MHLYREANLVRCDLSACVATIGNFDGMHLGHQQVLKRLQQAAVANKLTTLVILFEPQPMEFFLGNKASPRLMTLREKLTVLADYHVDNILCLRFNEELAQLSAKKFVEEILIKKLRVKHLIVGDDFSFGRGRLGGFETLHQYQGIVCEQLTGMHLNGVRISSSYIRQALAVSDFATANQMLARPYTISGVVAHGDGRGHELGFPTANIYLHHKVLPLRGVFISKVHGLQSESLLAVTNVGNRPTIKSQQNVLEAHILNFNQNIYGKRIKVEFISKLRDEKRFKSLDELQQCIEQDVINTKNSGKIIGFRNNRQAADE